MIVRLKSMINGIAQGWSPQCENRPAEPDEWGVLKVGCVNGDRFDDEENKALPGNLDPIPALEVRRGDVLISRANTRELVGGAALVGNIRPRLLLCDKLYRLRLRSDLLDSRFLIYAFKSTPVRHQVEAFATGASSSMKNISQESLKELELWLPLMKEQRRVADFLDGETAKIDGLIAKQTEFLTLLDEHRRALITEAVTLGLDPSVPMRETGIETFPRVPSHWAVKRLKHVAGDVTVGVVVTPSKYYAEAGIPALRSLNVRPMEIVMDDMVFFDEHSNQLLAKSMLRADDIVAVRTGKPGTTAVVNPDLDGANCIDLILIRHSPRIHSRFVAYTMNSDLAQAQYTEGSEGAIQQHFNIETAKNLLLPVPPVAEQIAITSVLDTDLARLDATRARSAEMIARLRERRSALITAAVTGQIDVTGAHISEAAA